MQKVTSTLQLVASISPFASSIRGSRLLRFLGIPLLLAMLMLTAAPVVFGALSIVQEDKLTPSETTESQQLGYSVSISGDTALIGALDDQPAGAAYVYIRDGSGNWSEQAKLAPSDAEGNDGFGFSVSISGDTALVGAFRTGTA